jgi:hypothetical protein
VIHKGDRFTVTRGRRVEDGRPVVMKIGAPRVPRDESARLLRHEYELLVGLDIDGVARPVELVTDEGRAEALVLADAGPQDLAERLKQGPLEPGACLDLAVRMTQIVAALPVSFRTTAPVWVSRIVMPDSCPGTAKVAPSGLKTTFPNRR